MADETTGDKPAEKPAAEAENTTTDTSKAVVEKADNPDAVKNALDAERKAAKEAKKRADAAEAKVREFEEKDKSELEKLTGKLTKAEVKAQEAEAKLLRFTVAAEKNIPAEAVELLQGTTREELEANADKILELVKSRTENENKPDFDGGVREPADDNKNPEEAHRKAVIALLSGQRPN